MLGHEQGHGKHALAQLAAFLREPGADLAAVLGMATPFHQSFAHQSIDQTGSGGALTDGRAGKLALGLPVLLPEMMDDRQFLGREGIPLALEFLPHPHPDDVGRAVHDEPQRVVQIIDGGSFSRSLHNTIGVLCT